MSTFTQLFGDKLQGKEGSSSTASALADLDAVLIYFSAHWCPPCRGFTPKLSEAYKAYKAKGLKLEVIFVSSDRDEPSFAEYFGEMPWLALPYSERDAKNTLSKKFKVSGIPSLVVLDGKTGETITTDGRSAVMEDPEGAKFPWKPPTLWEALGESVVNQAGESVSVASLRGAGKVLGVYFSAHWCPPCRAFTPNLVKTAKAVKAAGKQFEMIFVSSDKSADEFKEYFGSMESFHAIPFGDERKAALSKVFEVEGIPHFAVIDAESGATINGNARGAVSDDPEGKDFPWVPPAVASLASPDGINDETSLCLMVDGCSEEVRSAALAVLTPIAEASKAAGSDMLFFAAKSAEGAVGQVRKLCKVQTASALPQLLLVDIPDNGGFYVNEPAECTTESVELFLQKYKAKELQRQQLG